MRPQPTGIAGLPGAAPAMKVLLVRDVSTPVQAATVLTGWRYLLGVGRAGRVV